MTDSPSRPDSDTDTDPAVDPDATIDDYRVPTPEEFRYIRRDLGVSQADLALAIGSSQTTISQFELGHHDILSNTLREAVEHLRENQ